MPYFVTLSNKRNRTSVKSFEFHGLYFVLSTLDTGRKLKTLGRRPERLIYVEFTPCVQGGGGGGGGYCTVYL